MCRKVHDFSVLDETICAVCTVRFLNKKKNLFIYCKAPVFSSFFAVLFYLILNKNTQAIQKYDMIIIGIDKEEYIMKSKDFKRLLYTIFLSSLLLLMGGCSNGNDTGKGETAESGKDKTDQIIKVSGTVYDIQKYRLIITTEEDKKMEFIDKDSNWHYMNSELTVGDKVEIAYIVNDDQDNVIKEAWQKSSTYAEENEIKTITGKITDIQKQYYMIEVEGKDIKIQNTSQSSWHFAKDELTIGDVVKVNYKALSNGDNEIIEAWQQTTDNVKTVTGEMVDIQKQYYIINVDGNDMEIRNTDQTKWHFVRKELTIGDSVKVNYKAAANGDNEIIEAWQQ